MAGERGEGIARRCKCKLERVFLAQPLSMLVAKNFSPTHFLKFPSREFLSEKIDILYSIFQERIKLNNG